MEELANRWLNEAAEIRRRLDLADDYDAEYIHGNTERIAEARRAKQLALCAGDLLRHAKRQPAEAV